MAPFSTCTFTSTVFLAGLAVAATNPTYQIVDTYKGKTFFDRFTFRESVFTDDPNTIDPTGGFIHYRNRADAQSLGLIRTDDDGSVYLGVDHTTKMSNAGPLGRSSVRIESTTEYAHGLFIFDMAHFPKPVSGAWPAIWTYGNNWPAGGEVDIYENWNDNYQFNRQTLHTGSGCTVKNTNMIGVLESTNCDVYYSGDNQAEYQSCSADYTDNGVWGNKNGGLYAMEWNSGHIKMWFFQRNAIPHDITSGLPDPTTWGTPSFNTAGGSGSCDIDSHFSNQKIVFNIDFCGNAGSSWAWPHSSAYTQGGYASCWDYVAANPSAFQDVFFQINAVDVYQMKSSTPSSSSTTTTSSTSSTHPTSTFHSTISSHITTSSHPLTSSDSTPPSTASRFSTSVRSSMSHTSSTSSPKSTPKSTTTLSSKSTSRKTSSLTTTRSALKSAIFFEADKVVTQIITVSTRVCGRASAAYTVTTTAGTTKPSAPHGPLIASEPLLAPKPLVARTKLNGGKGGMTDAGHSNMNNIPSDVDIREVASMVPIIKLTPSSPLPPSVSGVSRFNNTTRVGWSARPTVTTRYAMLSSTAASASFRPTGSVIINGGVSLRTETGVIIAALACMVFVLW